MSEDSKKKKVSSAEKAEKAEKKDKTKAVQDKPVAKKTTKKSAKSDDSANGILTYKGKPLVRCGNVIYYGKPEDKYVAVFRLEDNKPLGDIQVAQKVIVELKTNEGKSSALIRQAEREGLYKALDVGMYWLEQALENGLFLRRCFCSAVNLRI